MEVLWVQTHIFDFQNPSVSEELSALTVSTDLLKHKAAPVLVLLEVFLSAASQGEI